MKKKINYIEIFVIVLQALIVIICLISILSSGKYDSVVLYSSTGIIAIMLLLYSYFNIRTSANEEKSIEKVNEENKNNEEHKDVDELKLHVHQLLDSLDDLMQKIKIDEKEKIVNEISKFFSKKIENIWKERKKDISIRTNKLDKDIQEFNNEKKTFENSREKIEIEIKTYNIESNKKETEIRNLKVKIEQNEKELTWLKDGISDFNKSIDEYETDILNKIKKYCIDYDLKNAEKSIRDITVKIDKNSILNDKFNVIINENENILNQNLNKFPDKYQTIIDSCIRNYILWLKLYKWYQNTIRNEKSFLKVDIELAQITKNLFHSLLLFEVDHWNYRILNGEKFDDLKPMGVMQNASNYSTIYEDYIRYCRKNDVSLKVFMEKNILLPEQIELGDNL